MRSALDGDPAYNRVTVRDLLDMTSGIESPEGYTLLDDPTVNAFCAPGGFVYLESPAADGEPELPAGWTLLRSKRAGEVGYHLARRDAAVGS